MAAVIVLFLAFEGLANPILAAAFGFEVAAAGQVGSLIDRDAAAVGGAAALGRAP